MELSDLTSVTVKEPLSSQLDSEERVFVTNLYQFMKDRGTPIERIPHLGFKQINLWKIYKAVDILGGYDSVTARRMWKNVYDELGGSPGSTSAATCTRRHYERLVLPFERHRRGEEDKPLPQSKPRKQYKRSEDSKSKGEPKKRRRTTEDDETNLRASLHSEHMCAHSASWPAGHPDGDCVSPHDMGLREKHLLQPLSPALVISPLEKKKRLAQASLNVAITLGLEESNEPERPSVIQLSHSATPSGRVSNASEGSPLPLSSPSSRSPSPFSVSSEDCVAVPTQKIPEPDSEKQKPANFGRASFSEPANVVRLPQPLPHGRPFTHKDQSSLSRAQYHNLHISPAHHDKSQKHPGFRLHGPATHASACWLPPTSSFKFVSRSVDPWRPVSLQPPYKPHIPLPKRPNSTETHIKKISTPLVFSDRKEKTKMVVPKPIPTAHQYLVQPGLPVPYLLPSFDRHRPDAAEHLKTLPLHPIFFPAQLSLPSSQPHPAHPLQVGTTFPGSYDATLRPYPYPMQVWPPPTGYNFATLQQF